MHSHIIRHTKIQKFLHKCKYSHRKMQNFVKSMHFPILFALIEACESLTYSRCRGSRLLDKIRQENGLNTMMFFRMNRREIELEHRVILVRSMSGFSLRTTYNPITALFRLGKRVDTSGYDCQAVEENDFDAGLRASLAAMDDGCAQLLAKDEIPMI